MPGDGTAEMPPLVPAIPDASAPDAIGLREVVLANLDSVAAAALLQSLF